MNNRNQWWAGLSHLDPPWPTETVMNHVPREGRNAMEPDVSSCKYVSDERSYGVVLAKDQLSDHCSILEQKYFYSEKISDNIKPWHWLVSKMESECRVCACARAHASVQAGWLDLCNPYHIGEEYSKATWSLELLKHIEISLEMLTFSPGSQQITKEKLGRHGNLKGNI